MISFYKWKKQAIFILLGIIPLMLFLFIFFPTIKFYTIEGYDLMYLDPFNVVLSILVAVVSIIVLIILANRWLRHAFTEMLEGKGLLAFVLDSTGLIASFNVKVNTPKMKGVFPNGKGPNIEDIYDTDLMQRLIVPKNAPMTKAFQFEKDENGKIKLGEEVDVIVLPKSNERYDKLFAFENRPVFIYNKVMGKFLSRDALAKFEKDMEIKHNALNILRKIQETDISFRNFARYIGENIKPMKKGFFASPLMKYIIIFAVVALIIFIILLFVPGFLSAGSKII